MNGSKKKFGFDLRSKEYFRAKKKIKKLRKKKTCYILKLAEKIS